MGGALPPTKATAISPYLPLKKNQLCTKKRGIGVKYKHWWRFVFRARRTATRRPRVVRRVRQRRQAGAAKRVLSWCLNGSGWASTVTHWQLLSGYYSDKRQFARIWTRYPVKETRDGAASGPTGRWRSTCSPLSPLFGAAWLCLRLAPPFLASGWFRQTARAATAQRRTHRPPLRLSTRPAFFCPSRYINALWVVGTLPPLRLHPPLSLRLSLRLTDRRLPVALALTMRLLVPPLPLLTTFVVICNIIRCSVYMSVPHPWTLYCLDILTGEHFLHVFFFVDRL